MQQLISKSNRVELTGNPLVDNGLAVIAALCKCKTIEDLTLRKMKNMHGNGQLLARNNMRIKANWMVFTNSITQQPSFSNKEKLDRYSKITTDMLKQIGNETVNEFCDFCGAPYSLEFIDVGRDWFPLVGSPLNDAQALPSASRSLNGCGKCLFAVQYLPQSALLVDGLLTVFQSTSMEFWYKFVKGLVSDYYQPNLGARHVNVNNKLETLGKKEGSRETVTRLLDVMKRGKKYDSNASMTMYQYTNSNPATLKKSLIPNFTLNFLHEAKLQGLAKDINDLTLWEVEGKKKSSYKYTFFSRITHREDYSRLYPSKEKKSNGASPELFLLYQTMILKYPTQSLYTAHKIAQFIKSKVKIEDVGKLVIDIQRDYKKQRRVKRWIVEMAKEGLVSFDVYYDLFIHSNIDNRNRWLLVKYYLLSQSDGQEFDGRMVEKYDIYNPEYKDTVIKVGNMIFDRIFKEKGLVRLEKILSRLAEGSIGRNWLITQFGRLADNNTDFDYSDNWRISCMNEYGQEDIYQFLYLLRLLFTTRIYKELTRSEVDAIKV